MEKPVQMRHLVRSPTLSVDRSFKIKLPVSDGLVHTLDYIMPMAP